MVEATCITVFKIRAYDPEHSQWHTVTYHNPLRLPLFDRLLISQLTPLMRDATVANAAFEQFRGAPARPEPSLRTLVARSNKTGEARHSVLLIIIESFNPSYVEASTMPFLSRLADRSLVMSQHYTTGNSTHLGILGLMYGEPPYFYGGTSIASAPKSAYIDAFNRRAYRTQLLGKDLYMDPRLKSYLTNFSESSVEAADTHHLARLFRSQWASSQPTCTVLYYFPTHFPYRHAEQYTDYLPETDDDCDYLEEGIVGDRVHLRNRYRNCLREADAWLENVLTVVDLDRTIVVVTGDHGEELFECGRLGHASYLDEPQIRVPCIASIPGCGHQVISEITSHSDLMPSIADALGWKEQLPSVGKSLFQPAAGRCAFVANNSHAGGVTRWAVVTPTGKAMFACENPLQWDPQIVDLYDLHDHRVSYSADPESWVDAFHAILRFETNVLSNDARQAARQ
jgi:membrane-anchored protein YejM (alkaline phosphatase superfamily)